MLSPIIEPLKVFSQKGMGIARGKEGSFGVLRIPRGEKT